MARFERPLPRATVPTASMADIGFLLLIFFMVTAILKLEEGLPVTYPRAESGTPVPGQKVAHVWVKSATEITIDDRRITLAEIAPVVAAKMREEPGLLVAVDMDRSLPWTVAGEVIEMLKEAQAVHAAFITDREEGEAGAAAAGGSSP